MSSSRVGIIVLTSGREASDTSASLYSRYSPCGDGTVTTSSQYRDPVGVFVGSSVATMVWMPREPRDRTHARAEPEFAPGMTTASPGTLGVLTPQNQNM